MRSLDVEEDTAAKKVKDLQAQVADLTAKVRRLVVQVFSLGAVPSILNSEEETLPITELPDSVFSLVLDQLYAAGGAEVLGKRGVQDSYHLTHKNKMMSSAPPS